MAAVERAGATPGIRLSVATPWPGVERDYTLLVVDDNRMNRDILTQRLGQRGYVTVTAEDGAQALDLMQAMRFDLVLLDVMMPRLDGYQVLQRMKADDALRHVPVIMVSAVGELDSVIRCIELGAEDYLQKPFNPVLLNARIGACLEKKRLRDQEVLHRLQLEQEKRRSDELLHVILPGAVVQELKATNRVTPRRYERVAILFCDIVGFTGYCERNPPETVLANLQALVDKFEDIALRHDVQKIKTIGDSFMGCSGLLTPTANPVLNCVRCGLEMVQAARLVPAGWQVRVGIHVGPVIAGLVGHRQFLFDIWGDTVNTAARIESHGLDGAVNVSGDAWQQIQESSRGASEGVLPLKGKGELEVFRVDGLR